jgi:hypothetical protein
MVDIVREEVVALTLDQRIDKMHQRDRLGAMAFVVVLWCALLFVMFSIWSEINNEAIRAILIIAGGMVLLFNTAAIVAMLRHYHGEKIIIYSLDILHLDEMRRRRAR